MPADTLSREAIERLCRTIKDVIDHGDVDLDIVERLARHALSEPARLAAARVDGVREALDKATIVYERIERYFNAAVEGKDYAAAARYEAQTQGAAVVLSSISGLLARAISPQSEPTGGTAEPSAPVAPLTIAPEIVSDMDEEIFQLRRQVTAMEERITALEAENAALKAELTKHAVIMDYDCPGDTPEPCGLMCQICGEAVEEDGSGHATTCPLSPRALLQGGPDAG